MTDKYDFLTFGAAKEMITPRERTTMIGFATVFGVPFTDIHDDLYVRTLLMEDADGEKVLLMGFDLLFHDDTLTKALRDYAYDKYGVKPGCLHISYSHTHYGPAVKGYDFNYTADSYEAFLLDRACASIDRAFLNTHKGTVRYGSVPGDWNISRRKPLGGGETDFRPNPDGEIDPELHLLRFCDESGRTRALLTSFACHPSNAAGYNTISSEYPGRLCACLEAEYYGCTALFFQGFGSDTKLRIGAKTSSFAGITYDEIDDVARSMTLGVKKLMTEGKWCAVPVKLGGAAFSVDLPLEVNPLEYYVETRDGYSKSAFGKTGVKFVPTPGKINETGVNSAKLFWACADYVIDRYDSLPDVLTLGCGAVRINPEFFIFSIAGEPSVNIQTVLKKAFPGKKILCFGYNDAIAYVPSDKIIEEGGYEAGDRSDVEYRLKGRCVRGVDEIFIRGFENAVKKISEER